MVRRVMGIVLGLIAGFVVVSIVEGVSSLLYGPPESLDFADAQAVRDFVSRLPAEAFLLVLLAHALGSFTAAFVCATIVRDGWLGWPLIVGLLLMIAGIVNLLMIPHPLWFSIADVVMYLPFAILGGRLAASRFGLERKTAVTK